MLGWEQRGILFSVVFTPPPPPAMDETSPSYHGSVWLLPVFSLLLTNTVSRVCGLAYPYDCRGFVGAKKKTILGHLELVPRWPRVFVLQFIVNIFKLHALKYDDLCLESSSDSLQSMSLFVQQGGSRDWPNSNVSLKKVSLVHIFCARKTFEYILRSRSDSLARVEKIHLYEKTQKRISS